MSAAGEVNFLRYMCRGSSPMNIVAFSPDSSRLLVAGNDNVVRLFDVEGGGAPRDFPQHKDAVSGSGGM